MRIVLLLLLAATALRADTADYTDLIGYTELRKEFGKELPDGSGIPVAHVEFIRKNTWAAESKGELSHISFIYHPEKPEAFSSHANHVGGLFYGSKSLVPGVRTVHAFRSPEWQAAMSYRLNRPPSKSPWRIENHSWGGTSGSKVGDRQLIGRLDYRIANHNLLACVGLDNKTGRMWPLLANSYNSITAGAATGRHNRGGTTLFATGRMKPDLVAPLRFTSLAVPVVSAAATLLIAHCDESREAADGSNPPVVKALLMAGATKDSFPEWTNSPTRPLDEIHGAGNLNVYHSYNILVAGKHVPGKLDTGRSAGWDWNTVPPSGEGHQYPFTVAANSEGTLSAVLAWNAQPLPGIDRLGYLSWLHYDYHLDNLALRLRKVDEAKEAGREVASSISRIDNIQHIYLTGLAPGNYALEVFGAAPDLFYGFAWRISEAPGETLSQDLVQDSSQAGRPESLPRIRRPGRR